MILCLGGRSSLEEAEDAVQEAAGRQDKLHGLQSHSVALSWQVQGRWAHAHGDAVPLFQLQCAVQQRRQLGQRIAACTAIWSGQGVSADCNMPDLGMRSNAIPASERAGSFPRDNKEAVGQRRRTIAPIRCLTLTGYQQRLRSCTGSAESVTAWMIDAVSSGLPGNVRGELEGGQDGFPQQDACAGPPACQLKSHIL